MHKDLSNEARGDVENVARCWVATLREEGESLAIAREAMINAFDEAAASGA